MAVPSQARILSGENGIPPHVFDRFAAHPDWTEIKRLAYLDGRDAMVRAASLHGVVVVPTFEALDGPDGDELVAPGSWSTDGLHVVEDVHRFVAERFRAHDGFGPAD